MSIPNNLPSSVSEIELLNDLANISQKITNLDNSIIQGIAIYDPQTKQFRPVEKQEGLLDKPAAAISSLSKCIGTTPEKPIAKLEMEIACLSPIKLLPEEILFLTFFNSIEDMKDFQNLILVNHQFQRIIKEPAILQKLCDAGLPGINKKKIVSFFDLYGNNITSFDYSKFGLSPKSIIQIISKCPNLESLNLLCIFDKINDLQKLKNLQIFDPCSDKDINYLKDLKNLQSLKFKAKKDCSDFALTVLKELPLKSLYINNSSSKITEPGLISCLSKLPLKELSLFNFYQPITNNTLSCLKEKTSLEKLVLSQSKITGNGLIHLKKLSQLRYLDLQHCSDIGNGLIHLTELPLKTLKLSNCNITNNSLIDITNLKLTELNIRCNDKITNKGLECLINMPLETLSLNTCKSITGEGLKHLNNLPISHLDIYNVPCQQKDYLQLVNLPLKQLIISENFMLSKDVLEELKNSNPSLFDKLKEQQKRVWGSRVTDDTATWGGVEIGDLFTNPEVTTTSFLSFS